VTVSDETKSGFWLASVRPALALGRRDLALSIRARGDMLQPVIFFVIVVSLFPLTVTPEPALIRAVAPGIIWVAALLATLLAMDGLFRTDYDDGSLEQLVLSPAPLSLLVVGKTIAHWLVTGLPLILVSPLLGVSMQLPGESIMVLILSLLLGTPALSLIGAVGVSLTLGARRSGVLLALIILPLYVPTLIFGAGAIQASLLGLDSNPHLLLLAACSLFSLAVCPLASAAALRISVN